MIVQHPEMPSDGFAWHISTYSGATNACVAVAALPGDAGVIVCNSNRPHDGWVTFTPAEWNAFLAGVQDGEFELPFLAALVH